MSAATGARSIADVVQAIETGTKVFVHRASP
jgi:hypothetical protein